MQHFKNRLEEIYPAGGTPLPAGCRVGFISRYQLELSDGVTESFLQLQWPLYAPLNALTAFCLTLILFALCGRWSLSTGLSGAVFTIIALINYYTRDLHGSALMPQDILNLGTAAEVMGSYTLKITQDVKKLPCSICRSSASPLCSTCWQRARPNAQAGPHASCA